MKMEPIEGSETSAIRTKSPGNYPKENILHIEHGESLKSRILSKYFDLSWSSSCKNLVLKNVTVFFLLKLSPFCTHDDVSKFGANEVLSFNFFVK